MRTILACTAFLFAGILRAADIASGGTLVVHEWGTFTSLQDEQGNTIGGVNTDEERLPEFVHDLRPVRMTTSSDLAPRFIKFAPMCAPEVTMRLETPVVYFHLPAGVKEMKIDLRVDFRGGIMSQFYPDARIAVDGATIEDRQQWRYRTMTAATTSTLEWKGLLVGSGHDGPPTESPVWLAPRQVASARVATPEGERERYLFYRGLGHLDAPLVARRSAAGTELEVGARPDALGSGVTLTAIPRLWLADLRGDGRAAMRSVPTVTLDADRRVSRLSATFAAEDYSVARLAALRSELREGLISEGLHADEAEALLATWQESYFKAPGQRLFFLVPRAWTERYLPLSVKPLARIERALMGRIELVSPAQRQAITRIAAGPVSDTGWWDRFMNEKVYTVVDQKMVWRSGGEALHQRIFGFNAGRERGLLAELGFQLPDDYRAYLALGRFRDALLLDEQRRRPDPELAKFIETYWVEGDRMMRDMLRDELEPQQPGVQP